MARGGPTWLAGITAAMTKRTIPEDVVARVRSRADDRCGYCLSPQHLVLGWLEIEHLIPKAKRGTDDEENLWLTCRLCNNFKGIQTDALHPESGQRVPLVDPRAANDGSTPSVGATMGSTIVGMTPSGRATVIALQLNNMIAVMVRLQWIAAGLHSPRA